MEIARYGPVLLGWTQAMPPGDRPARRRTADDLLRALVVELDGPADAVIERRCPECGASDHGVPVVADQPFVVSLAYADALVVAAAARAEDAASVGVDAEPAQRPVGDLAALFAPAPPPDLAGWTRIEAVLKATGRGIRMDPSTVEVGTEPGPLPGTLRTISPPGFAVATLDGADGSVVSLAVADGSRRRPSGAPQRR